MAQGIQVVTDGGPAEQQAQTVASDRADSARQLAQSLAVAAEQAGRDPEGGALWAAAGELQEFGLDDSASADPLYGRAVAHPEAPAEGFAGLRRLSRRAGEHALVGDLYRVEAESSKRPEQAIRALAQRALWLLHQGADKGYSAVTRELAELDTGDSWALMLAYLVREDLALLNGNPAETAELKQARYGLAQSLLDLERPAQRRELAGLAASIALTHRHLTANEREAAEWFERVLDLVPSETALRELWEIRAAREQVDDYAVRLAQFAEAAQSSSARGRAWYELGMIRAHRQDDPEGAREAFRRGMREPEGGAPAASPFLSLARANAGQAEPNDLVDALGLQAELAATERERADCLYQMALIFDGPLRLPEAAVELLRDALGACPGHRPAARALGRLYQRSGAWAVLAELLEGEVRLYPDSKRSRLKLAEVYQDRLGQPDRAEPHLRAILEVSLYPPAVRRFNRLLANQERWGELHDHLIRCAHRESNTRERLYDLERAAEIAEGRLDRSDLATTAWREIHEIDPLHPGALAALGRLYTRQGHWDDLIELNKDEIAVRDEPDVAARLWTKNGEIYEHHLSDEDRAQQCFELALEILPTYEPALEALGRILWRARDWDGLVEMYQAEIEQCGEAPRRIRRLLDLGELQATLAGRPDEALATFERVLQAEPNNEEALLWIERLHQSLGDDRRQLAALERRVATAEPDQRAGLCLRAGALAEWATVEAKRAWDHYVVALGHPTTRPHAVTAMARLWTALVADSEAASAASAALVEALSDEADPVVRGRMATLHRRLAAGEAQLEDWPAVLAQDGTDIVAAAATEIRGAVAGNVAELTGLRLGNRLGALWALMAQTDRPDGKVTQPAWLPTTVIAAELLAEIDQLECSTLDWPALFADDGETEGDEPTPPSTPTPLRKLVRAWVGGLALTDSIDGSNSIAALRLLAHDALERGDELAASRFAEREALHWTAPSNRQARLTKAAELRHLHEPQSARLLFESALGCNSYDKPTRLEVYKALSRCGEVELMIEGLADHVSQVDEPDERAKWLGRLAAALEQAGHRDRAAVAWDGLIEIEPTNAVAVLELLRLLTLEERIEEARATLERALRRPFSADARVSLLGRLADLHLMADGDGARAVAALEEAADLAEREPEWLRRLARAHYGYGSPDRAVQLLTEALPAEVLELDLGDWFLLARAKYLHLDDQDGARELLWGLFEQFPASVQTLRELETFYRKKGGAAELAERLSTLLVDPPQHLDSETHAFLWEYVGDLNYQVLRRNRDAEVAYEAALATGARPAVAEPRLALKVSRAIGQQPGKGREACAHFGRALRHPRVGVDEWLEAIEDLEALFESIEDQARVRVMHQIRDLLQEKTETDSDEARVKRDPARQLEPDVALKRLTDGLVGAGSIETMTALSPILERCFGHRRAKRRALGGRRLKVQEAPELLALVELGSETLQAGTPRIFAGAGSDQPEWLSNGGFWLPRLLVDTSGWLTQRFWAGHIVGFTAFPLAPNGLAEAGEIAEVLSEIRRLGAGGSVISDDPVSRVVGASRFSAARERIGELLEEHGDLMERAELESWSSVPLAVADRVGLLFSGDVRASIDGLLSLEDEHRSGSRGRRIVAEPRTRGLLEYALSFSYQEIRYLCGLAGKPKVL